jgi:signal transduction histidine kinase
MFGTIPLMNPLFILLAAICDLAAIKNGGAQLYRAGERFAVTGHVITANPKSQNITFWKRPHSIVVHVTNDTSTLRHDVKYRLEGRLQLWNGWKKEILSERLVPVETNSYPAPIDSTISKALNGDNRHSLVRIKGVIVKAAEDEADAKYCWLTLKNEEGTLAAFCQKKSHPFAGLSTLIGAEVRLTGVSRESVTWRQHLPRALMLVGRNPIEVLRPSQTDPERLPRFSSTQALGRQRIDGVVIASSERGFILSYLENKKTNHSNVALICESTGQPRPSIGESVIIAGFASFDSYHLKFDEALVKIVRSPRKAEVKKASSAKSVPIPRLFTDETGKRKIAAQLHGRLLRVRGTVRDIPHESTESRRIIIEEGGYRVEIDTASLPGAIPWIKNNAVIEVAGILTVEYEPAVSAYALPRFERFTLLPRTVDDLRLVRSAPWWTPERLLGVIVALLGVIIWISYWNRTLRSMSARRGEKLYRERIAHAAAELKVEERTRLAVEIHDSISQTLTGIALQFDNGADEAVVRQMLASCRHELKNCLWDLRSRTFEEKDMTEAVRRAIGPNAGSAKVDVRFNVPRSDLSETTTHAILRIVRELVINAVRHGQASEIKVAGESHDGTISFSVRDNGCGFNPSNVAGPSTGHFGLQGIRERLNAFGGKLKIESEPGRGTKITAILSTLFSAEK